MPGSPEKPQSLLSHVGEDIWQKAQPSVKLALIIKYVGRYVGVVSMANKNFV